MSKLEEKSFLLSIFNKLYTSQKKCIIIYDEVYRFGLILFGFIAYQALLLFNAKFCLYIRGAFNKFADFFVQTFKIGVDSW